MLNYYQASRPPGIMATSFLADNFKQGLEFYYSPQLNMLTARLPNCLYILYQTDQSRKLRLHSDDANIC